MTYDDVIILINAPDLQEPSPDGSCRKAEPVEREVFCRVASIGAKEFYEAQALGLQPEIKFVLADDDDYDNEQSLIYDGCRYRVLRTYRSGRELELTCYKELNP